MTDFLRFLLFLRLRAQENAEEGESARASAITTRSLLLSLSSSLFQPVRYFPDFLRFLPAAGTVARISRVCFACPNFHGAGAS